jgi:hypothetical protein
LIKKQFTAVGHLSFTELQVERARERALQRRLDELASQVDILEAAIGHD